ncbi:hypothetical protein QTP88_029275 [Uroleucon formosanum]
MQPLAQALDLLQGDTFVAMGYLIPTIKWLKKELKELLIIATICKSCKSTISHPKFKFKGMSIMEREEATDILQSEREYFK